MVGGMCSLLLYGTGICLYAFIKNKNKIGGGGGGGGGGEGCSFCPFLSLKRFFFNLVINRLDDDTSMSSSQALLYLKEK